MTAIRRCIAGLVEGHAPSAADLSSAMGEVMDGKAHPSATAALLVALRMKGETVDEIVAVAEALRARAEMARPKDPMTIDTCGTGGSGLDTFNISTTAAFVVAGAGASVAKHGNRAASSQSGSFDVLEALGIHIDLPIATNARLLDEVGIAPFFARTAHPAFRHVAPVRAELGVRTLLNCLGPLLSPVGARYQVVGVYSETLVKPLAEALKRLGAERALVVHGRDGLDELTTTTQSEVAWVEPGGVRCETIDPADLGLARAMPADLKGGDALINAAITREILDGEKGPKRDIVLLNAAAALVVVSKADDLQAGLELAEKSIDSGAARAKLKTLAQRTQEEGERDSGGSQRAHST